MDNSVLQNELKRRMREQGLNLLQARASLIDSVDVAVDEVRDELTGDN